MAGGAPEAGGEPERMGGGEDRNAIRAQLRGPDGDRLSDDVLRSRRIDPNDTDIIAARKVGELSRMTRDPALRLVLQRQIPPGILGAMIETGEMSRDDPQLRAAIAAMLEEAEGVPSDNLEVLALVEEVKVLSESTPPAGETDGKSPSADALEPAARPSPQRTLHDISDRLNQRLEQFGDELQSHGVSRDSINLFLNGYRRRMAERDVQDESEVRPDTQVRFETFSEEIDRFKKIYSHWRKEAEKGKNEQKFFQDVIQGLVGVAGLYLSSYDTLRIDLVGELERIRTLEDLDGKYPTINIAKHMEVLIQKLEEREVPDADQRSFLLTFYAQAIEVSYSYQLLGLLYEQTLEEAASSLREEEAGLEAPEPGDQDVRDSSTRVLSFDGGRKGETPPDDEDIHDSPTSVLVFEGTRDAYPNGGGVGRGPELAPLPQSQVPPPSQLRYFTRLERPSEEKHYFIISIKRSWEFLGSLRVPAERWPQGVIERLQDPGEFPQEDLKAVENYAQALYHIIRLGSDPQEIRGEEPLPVEEFATSLDLIGTSRQTLTDLGVDPELLPDDVCSALHQPETFDEEELIRYRDYLRSLSVACELMRVDARIPVGDVNAVVEKRLVSETVIEDPSIIDAGAAALRNIVDEVVYPQMKKNGRYGGLAIVDFMDPETTALFRRLAAENDWQEIPSLAQGSGLRDEFRHSVAPRGVYGFLRDASGGFKKVEVEDRVFGGKTSRLVWKRFPSREYRYVRVAKGWRWRNY